MFARNTRYFTIFTKFLMKTELQVFVLVRVTVNAPLVRASLTRITRTGTSTERVSEQFLNGTLAQCRLLSAIQLKMEEK